MQPKKITIINRHYPPSNNITGENAWDLASYLIKYHQIEVSIIYMDIKDTVGGNNRISVGNTYPIKTFYKGNHKIIRYLTSLIDGYNLISKAIKLNHGCNIVMTSPPLLPMWASLLFGKKKWILWSMDLFPEGFAASNGIKISNFFYKYVLNLTYKNAPNKIIALGPNQKKSLDKKYNKQIEHVILPCGVFLDQNKILESPVWKLYPDKIYFGYCGNCGNAHSKDFIIEVINSINPLTQHMVLAVYGIKSDEVRNHAIDKSWITILDYVPRNELHHIDVHLVTLINSWTHIAVPSKAVSSICAGATILFCGNKESDNWHLLKEAGWHVNEDFNLRNNVRQLITNINWNELEKKKVNALNIAHDLTELIKKNYDKISCWAI